MAQPDPAGFRDDEDAPEPPSLRRLRLLVTTLTVVLILGMLVIVAAMVVRLGLFDESGPAGPIAAERLTLPDGAEVLSLGRAEGQILILTRDANGAETLRVFDAATGARVSETPVARE